MIVDASKYVGEVVLRVEVIQFAVSINVIALVRVTPHAIEPAIRKFFQPIQNSFTERRPHCF